MADNVTSMRICANCQKEFGLDISGVKGISHGVCVRHATESLQKSGLKDAAARFLAKYKDSDDLDLSDPQRLTQTKALLDAFRMKSA